MSKLIKFNFLLSFFLFILCVSVNAKPLSKDEAKNLTAEMTKTTLRQNIALHKLSKFKASELEQLRNYFNDKRKIADPNVRFLNRNPKAFERYFLTSATTVDEVVLQYYCFRTSICIPPGTENERDEVRKKFPIGNN